MQRLSLIQHAPAPFTVRSELFTDPAAAVATADAWRAEGLTGDFITVTPTLSESPVSLAVCDVDSTFIEQEVIELIAAHAGVRDEVARITDAAMRGELDFEESLRARVSTLAGLPARVLDEVAQEVVLTAGAAEFTNAIHAAGGRVALVSGGFDLIVQRIAAAVGVDYAEANHLEVVDGKLTGRVLGTVVDRAHKATVLRRLAADWQIDLSRTIAVGDGANDLDMVTAAGMGFAFCAKPALVEAADASVTVRRLDAITAALMPAS